MKLKHYLKKERITWEQFADRANLSRQTIYNVMRGSHKTSSKTISKIIKASNGEVKFTNVNKNQ